MAAKYQIYLTPEERAQLDGLVKKGQNAAQVILKALILLFCDRSPEGRGGKTNLEISRDLNVSQRTIESLKKRFLEGGLALALNRKEKAINPNSIKFDGAFKAKLLALADSPPPEGRPRWTARLLAQSALKLGFAPKGLSHMTVYRTLKKANLDLASKNLAKAPQRDGLGS
jgi:transposase